ncbi:murein transglycosylase A [Hyphobacterium marinum]|uniref:peptidoglycan lytic exotransglycosylase n=1 Tax=Hyphobacterium marinum TaxID=3116574 RepID=A0ABU7LUY7_9PROT|nr:MltA domain-containing protein [Hyphobacterium sp. Y6023]MEE2565383.1 MltA domain-containing protein [Hyphobacterium sp. Y6023]
MNVKLTAAIRTGVWRASRRSSPLVLAALLAACGPRETPPEIPDETPQPAETVETGLLFEAVGFDALPGWAEADPRPALGAFRRSCARLAALSDDTPLSPRVDYAGTAGEWRRACALSALDAGSAAAAREAFEAAFRPVAISAPDAVSGMITGYYEPEVDVRREPDSEFSQPLRARPDDLLTADLGAFDERLAGQRIVGRAEGRAFIPYRSRGEIEAQDAGTPLAWGRPIDVFFLQIQGSGRLVWDDGATARAAFAAHNGLPYTSIGRVLIDRGEMDLSDASKDGIEAWLEEAGPATARALFNENPRYAFFAIEPLDDPSLGPRGAAGISLTPMASIAADPAFHPFGVPVWLQASLPDAPTWAGLVVTQDTGGAITGPLRADLFYGWGDTAERRAGSTRAQASWTVLLPVEIAERLTAPPA